ncbi:AAA family ATPase [Bacillus sp. FJAT-49736]|uniref:AAA family ATPase n=1 Tax=Bacillus sp. FJAT-49736 TaxID=2833582 RepID=UPI001BC94FC6|nr:AAA family ATPase [Bacillus sp. FJAT-49736]MBS4173442.1 AAA family ATPase [Bacillus sp. FJAT-49736]
MFLESVQLKSKAFRHYYPFSLPIFDQFQSINFQNPVTIFIGENGSGKSTFLQGIAASCNLPAAGGAEVSDDPDFLHAKELADSFLLKWKVQTKTGFFLRAEDFLSFTNRIKQMRVEAENELKSIEEEYKHKSAHAKSLASMPHKRTLHELQHLYQNGLDTRSHGESFLDFFQARIRPNGLYLLDEPEVPLSPMRQLTFISILLEAIQNGSQFIIVTHSPILMGIPNSDLFTFDSHPPVKINYEETEHVQITKQFLEFPQRFIKYL